MNEWDLQRVLTKQWSECGLCINGKRHMLVAWEIMPESWRVNDPDHHWTEPSLDFLLADELMQLTVVELKTKVPGVKPAWQVLCQVTHRTSEVVRTASMENLNKAYQLCSFGSHERVQKNKHADSVSEQHRRHFGLAQSITDLPRDIHRCVAACEFGESWPEVLQEFNSLSGVGLKRRAEEEFTSKQAARELARFKSLPNGARFSSPVFALDLSQ